MKKQLVQCVCIMAIMALGFGFAFLGTAEQASAALCTTGTTCDLTFWNDTNLNLSGDKVVVTLGGLTGGLFTTINFTWVDGNGIPPSAIGIDQIGWTGTVGVSATGCATGWNCNLGTQNMDGFGSFSQFQQKPGGTGLNITFTLASGVTGFSAFPSNGAPNNAQFAAHVRYGGDCSGFVSNGTTTPGTNGACAAVPEPMSLMLLGAGLAGVGIWRRKLVRL
jgi:PEP-CTERM motif-containing protein